MWCCLCGCFTPYSSTQTVACRVIPDFAILGRVQLSLLGVVSKPSYNHPEPGCGVFEKGKNLWLLFSVFLPWRARRLTDISNCFFPECCDKMKHAQTGTCNLFPSWSLICHCWRLEDLNGSEADTSFDLLPNTRSNLCVPREFSLPAKFSEGRWNLYYYYSYRRSQLSWPKLYLSHGILSKSPELKFP